MMDYFSEECEHVPFLSWMWVDGHALVCLISGGLHSWKSQNYASHTWFSH